MIAMDFNTFLALHTTLSLEFEYLYSLLKNHTL